ncbi:LPS-assembly protein LptD [Helicobacter cappadocius]|uniref:LPS assembly protein LptD n=1 Tax=Helicobacter cappadocius TaxID=3063998 RepID=A0AA90PKC1_9HELI|nr:MULTISPECIES: LPS assembly protein LptD [unclassified Helicobacter]MDO7253578.1 LPS assembly protein LptD [Helicobacter sp. faydin-H75]MDP2539506.1 LPS assembly protein LptD [Helicobacter sp. faydin-H76]
MIRFSIVFIILSCFVFATQSAVQKFDKNNNKVFELLADSVKGEGNVVVASGNAVLLNTDIYILADRISYDTKNRVATIDGNIKIYKGGGLFARAEHIVLNMNEKYEIINPFYLQDGISGLWISSENAENRDKKYSFKRVTVSGCSIENPIWHIDATSGSYNSDKSALSLWNPKIYIGDIPILYFPYIHLSTSTKRTTGLLYPEFAASNTEGFVYMQPFYLALQDFWDMTLTPQVRTNRGYGANFEARFINKEQDKFSFTTRFFHNNMDYYKKYSLRNKNVYGFELAHTSRDPLQKYFGLKNSIDNGLYLDFLYMNDLDYARFENINTIITDGTHMSRGNYYVQTENNYYGINFKYFINLNKINNDTTFQSLPNLQYHKYLDSLFFKNLLYSLDYQFKNTTRDIGYGYVQNSLNIPVGLQFSLFKKYISLGIWNNIYMSNAILTRSQNTYIPNLDKKSTREYGNILSAGYSIYLNSDLAKDYNKVFHTIQFQLAFNAPYFELSNGLFDSQMYKKTTLAKSLYSKNSLEQYLINGKSYSDIWDPNSLTGTAISAKTMDIGLTQYFYGLGAKELFYWKITQTLNFDDPVSIARIPMENKIGFSPLKGLDMYASIFYSFYYNALDEIALNANYKYKYMIANLSYYIKRDFRDDGINKIVENSANYLKGGFSNDFGYFGLSASAGYDIKNNVLLDWDVGIFKNIRCFGIGLKFVNQRRPILTNDPGNPLEVLKNTYIKLELNFVPLTNTGLTYRITK